MKRFLGSASHKRFSGAQLNVEHWREALETDALAPARARNAPVAPETALDSSVSGRKAQPPRLPGSLLAVRLRIVGVVALEDLLSHEVPERVLGHTVLRPPKSSSSSPFGARQQPQPREARLQGRNHRTRLVLHVQLQVVERLVALTPIVHVDALDVVLEFALEEPQRSSFTSRRPTMHHSRLGLKCLSACLLISPSVAVPFICSSRRSQRRRFSSWKPLREKSKRKLI